MNWKKLLSALFISAVIHLSIGESIVQTENGPIRGITVASGKVEAFLGIPYAEPPLGSLRFSKPVPKRSWNIIYDARRLPPPCIQTDIGQGVFISNLKLMSEDCLYLNIWIPSSQYYDNELKPIMVFIHGGGFISGSSSVNIYDGARLAELGDVVVVTINYRLGASGFFVGFTEDAPGNQGFYDMILALRWIKQNSRHFGGDPNNIVIFGESSGAHAVSLLQVSPLSKNLFNRAILQSGSAINPMYTVDNKEVMALNELYAKELGCSDKHTSLNNSRKDVLSCLRKLQAEKIAETEKVVLQKRDSKLLPRFGDDFLPENSVEMFRKGLFKDSDVLMGINRDEGTFSVASKSGAELNLLVDKDIFNETIAYNFINQNIKPIFVDPEEINKTILSYLDDVNVKPDYTYLKAVSEALGDHIINCGNIFQAEYHSMRDNQVYFYMFNHRTSASPYPEWMGVPHFEEVQYVFGNPMFKHFTEEEKVLSRKMMTMWTNFAKTGNPSIPGEAEWPRYNYKDPKYYVIGCNDQVAIRPDNYRCERWRNVFRSPIDVSVIDTLKKP